MNDVEWNSLRLHVDHIPDSYIVVITEKSEKNETTDKLETMSNTVEFVKHSKTFCNVC